MTETISMTLDSEDLQEFKKTTGMSVVDCIKILINSIKYGGKPELDPFWSDESINHLKKSINDMKEGKVVTFTSEQWEAFVNEQDLL